jgi:hypothetical protein
VFAAFLGVTDHDRTDLISDLGAAAGDQLVMHPGDENDIAVPAVAELPAQLVADLD